MRNRTIAVLTILAVTGLFVPLAGFAQGFVGRSAALLDSLTKDSYKPVFVTAFGTFTYGDDHLASGFSRQLEAELGEAMTKTKGLKLFNRNVAAAMQADLREMYGEFFATNPVDALLSGRFFEEGSILRIRLELTDLSTGILIGSGELTRPRSELSPTLSIRPEKGVLGLSESIASVGQQYAAVDNPLRVSVSTDRGTAAAYRKGEALAIDVLCSKDAYLKVYHIDVKGSVRLIWPNRFETGQMVRGGILVKIPGSNAPFTFLLGEPFGTEFIKVVASTTPFRYTEEDFRDLGNETKAILVQGAGSVGYGKGDSRGFEQAEGLVSFYIGP